MIILIVLGLVIYRDILNPISIYNSVWFIVVGLYMLQLTPLQADLTNTTLSNLLWTSIVFSIFCLFSSKVTLVKVKSKSKEKISEREINFYFKLWIIIEIIEVIYSRGFPMLWSLSGSSKTYFDFGIPSVHGFANAFGLALVSVMFMAYIEENNKVILCKIIGMAVYYVLLLTRQVIISMVIQLFIIYCFKKGKVPWGKIIVGGVVGIISFGILGNIRTGYTEFLNVAMIKTEINPLLVGVYWVYMYLTMTIANLNKVFSISFHSVGIIHILSVYMPSFIRNIFYSNKSYGLPNYLVTQAFNVSGYFMDFFLSYKAAGMLFIAGVYGLLGGIIYKKNRRDPCQKNAIYFAIYLQIIFLSFFYNHLLYLPSGFQFIIIFFMFKKIKVKFGNKVGKRNLH